MALAKHEQASMPYLKKVVSLNLILLHNLKAQSQFFHVGSARIHWHGIV